MGARVAELAGKLGALLPFSSHLFGVRRRGHP